MTSSHDVALDRAVRRASVMRQGFYIVVLLVALAGQVSGAVQALDIPLAAAIPAVGALELGGIVVLANADVRRRLGERAVGSRLLSAAIAAGAVAFNWLAHDDHLVGGFFAGMSALGYLVWLTHTENQRRDRLRATGDAPPTTPAYEVVGHWLRHPLLTRRARSLAKADPALGLYGSTRAARTQVARERRQRAIAKVLHRKIRSAVDPATADIALAVYDLEEIAARLSDRADYDRLTDLIAVDLLPERLAPGALPDPLPHATTASEAVTALAPATPTALSPNGAATSSVDHPAPPAPRADLTPPAARAASTEPAPSTEHAPTAEGAPTGERAPSTERVPTGERAPSSERVLQRGAPSAALTEASAEFQVLAAVRRELEELQAPTAEPRRRTRAATRATPPAPAHPTPQSPPQSPPRSPSPSPPAPSSPPEPVVRGATPAAREEPSLRRRVHETLDRFASPDGREDHTTLVDLVTAELRLDDLQRITASTYVQTWKRDAQTGTRTPIPQQATR
ncbi:hypothetical protein WEI85_42295 [Actinomycetes bacterium KLBMP 9797]